MCALLLCTCWKNIIRESIRKKKSLITIIAIHIRAHTYVHCMFYPFPYYIMWHCYSRVFYSLAMKLLLLLMLASVDGITYACINIPFYTHTCYHYSRLGVIHSRTVHIPIINCIGSYSSMCNTRIYVWSYVHFCIFYVLNVFSHSFVFHKTRFIFTRTINIPFNSINLIFKQLMFTFFCLSFVPFSHKISDVVIS